MNPRFAAHTDIGRVRKKNEDAFLVDAAAGLYAVADGMGGHRAGEVASNMALQVLSEELAGAAAPDPRERLAAAVHAANDRVFAESVSRGHAHGMGTTLTAFWIPPESACAYLGHVGDSRCYRLRDGLLEQMTHDHSWVQVQVDEGRLSPAEAVHHPLRNVITRSIGFEADIEPDVAAVRVQPGDVYLIASDGLTAKVPELDIADLLGGVAAGTPLRTAVEQLIGLANEMGGEDNITAIIVSF